MNALIAVGAVNALCFALLVQTKRTKGLPDHILSLFFLLDGIGFGAVYAAFEWQLDGLFLMLEFSNLIYAPLFFLYVRAMVATDRRLPRRWPLHFVVPLAAYLYQALFLVFHTEAEIVMVYNSQDYAERPPLHALFDLIDISVVPVYCAWCWRLLRRHRRQIAERFSFQQAVDYRWLSRVIIYGLASWVVIDLSFLGSFFFDIGDEIESLWVGCSLAALGVLYIGYYGLRQATVYADPYVPTAAQDGDSATAPRYQKSGLNQEELEEYRDRLLAFMKSEQPHLNSTLTIRDLAASLGLSEHNLSEVINVGVGKPFYDFVNHYRVEAFKHRVNQPGAENLTLLAIALECGFNSKSSFNRVFKQQLGVTPSSYVRSQR